MKRFFLEEIAQGDTLSSDQVASFVKQLLVECGMVRHALLIPPDYTRLHSGGGKIACHAYQMLMQQSSPCQVEVLPALGTHEPVSEFQRSAFFPDIPADRFLVHNWRSGVREIGTVPASFVHAVSEGLMDQAIPVEVSLPLLQPDLDLILSIGQVVPHEVVGMSNYTKNILVGTGGAQMIGASHMLGAMVGLEAMMGRIDTPVRAVFDYAQANFLDRLPIVYLLTVTTNSPQGVRIHGLFAGNERRVFEHACTLAKEKNLIFLSHPMQKAVVYLDTDEFTSTWLGNKAVYRTRMAIADGGELLVLAPGITHFGEDPENDRLIRKYGYRGREAIISLYRTQKDLQQNQSVAAHLIHGSTDGRFSVTYACQKITRAEMEGVGYHYLPYAQALERYNPQKLHPGFQVMPDGEEIFFIENPALGLWSLPI